MTLQLLLVGFGICIVPEIRTIRTNRHPMKKTPTIQSGLPARKAEEVRDTTQPIDEYVVFDKVVGGPYKNRVYSKGAFKISVIFSASVTGALKSGTFVSITDNEVRE